ncbi:MAG: Asp23/Gls24 family envelope stress response protein [Clostridiales bacterium]|nr:Asp23/Gls24 family envelope stress response protein [Clostridiales bacterium]
MEHLPQVVAFVGPAGTGKSHRASLLAEDLGIPAIIDDGLLILHGHIAAGTSAKREPTAMAAVRRAVFADPQHAREVREALLKSGAERVLVLGTSKEMVHLICDALDLPRPQRYIPIHEVASPEEMRQARRIRRSQGKHVIPAPTLEVKRSFSGYLVDPLRVFTRRSQPGPPVEKSVVRPTYSALGRFFIDDAVIGAIARYGARSVPGVLDVRWGSIDTRPEGIRLRLDIWLPVDQPLPPILEAVQKKVRQDVEAMTALNVLAVDLVVRRLRRTGEPVVADLDRDRQGEDPLAGGPARIVEE